jgi:CheY-like chemotaxis protein
MSALVRCPDCKATWSVDERARRGELLCPTCLTRIRLDTACPPVVPEVAPEAAPARPVVCPRCQLHFTLDPETVAPPPPRRGRILVIEDQDYFRQVALDTLGAKYDVQAVRDAEEGRQALRAGRFDLLVLGLVLGERDDAGRHLMRALAPRKPCPILIYTESDESEVYGDPWDELVRLGADDLVLKGMHAESLLRKVDRLLEQDIALQETKP